MANYDFDEIKKKIQELITTAKNDCVIDENGDEEEYISNAIAVWAYQKLSFLKTDADRGEFWQREYMILNEKFIQLERNRDWWRDRAQPCKKCKGEGIDPDLGTDKNPEVKCQACNGTGVEG